MLKQLGKVQYEITLWSSTEIEIWSEIRNKESFRNLDNKMESRQKNQMVSASYVVHVILNEFV